jgi:hypothetical protein
MTDLFYIVITLVLFVLSWGFIIFCERLMENKK